MLQQSGIFQNHVHMSGFQQAMFEKQRFGACAFGTGMAATTSAISATMQWGQPTKWQGKMDETYETMIKKLGAYGCFLKWWYPKSSVLIGFSIINHPFWGTPIFGNTHTLIDEY